MPPRLPSTRVDSHRRGRTRKGGPRLAARRALRTHSGRAETVANLVHGLSLPIVERAANVIAVVDVSAELHLDQRTLHDEVLVERVELVSDLRVGVQNAKGPGADLSQRLVCGDGRVLPGWAA